jgi:hypothetical protein
MNWMKEQSKEFFSDDFEKLFHHWKKCVENDGDYVEK